MSNNNTHQHLYVNCEQEEIHLCGNIQAFGYLLVFNRQKQCIAYSENTLQLFPQTVSLHFQDLVSYFHLNTKISAIEEVIYGPKHEVSDRFVDDILIAGKDYYISIYVVAESIYVELEQKNIQAPHNPNLYFLAKHIDDSGNAYWKALCEKIYSVIGYDRVMVYKFLEDGSGQVVAEHVSDGLEPLLGYRYPEFDIPKQARELYTRILSRVTPDVNQAAVPVLGLPSQELDLSKTAVRALSPVHLEYLRNAQVQASGSFSIIKDGKLWGLVACQNLSPKMIDLNQRHLCVFLTQYAVNRHSSMQKQEELAYQQEIEQLLLNVNANLLINKDVLLTLKDFSKDIMDFTSSDGMAIKYDDEFLLFNERPNACEIKKVRNYIEQQKQEPFYITDNFPFNEVIPNSSTSFPGILRLDFLDNLEIYLFRKEILIEETWAGKPEKILKYNPQLQYQYASPRTSFDAWKQEVKGKSAPWLRKEKQFAERLSQLVRKSFVRKINEIQELNNQLKTMNNALDTFSYTLSHDLKNPLSSIKLSAQILQQKLESEHELVAKMCNNILESVTLMTDMLDKTLAFSKAKSWDFSGERIEVEQFLMKIVDDSVNRYNPEKADIIKISIGELLPVYGDRTLLYQLFLNVISNAVKYSSREEFPQISINSRITDDNYIVYEVEDNGIGISSENKEKIFEIFKRLSNAQDFEGSGVGLTIVKRIMDKLNGKIEIDSELGEGTVFRLSFVAEEA